MDSFGAELRRRRMSAGLRQADVILLLQDAIARSTLANIEVGREPPTDRFWQALSTHLPDWARELADDYEAARRDALRKQTFTRNPPEQLEMHESGGPFLLQTVNYTYVFGHSHSPEEIIEVRRVKATESGARSFGLYLSHRESTEFDLTQEALWGGQLGEHEVRHADGTTVWLRRFDFDRQLRKGQSHEFAVRSWIEEDGEPQHAVMFDLSLPARQVSINLLFNGPEPPKEFWSYEVRAGVANPTEDDPPTRPDDPAWLFADQTGHVRRTWLAPDHGVVHGVSWSW
jgi:hypothetical protein